MKNIFHGKTAKIINSLFQISIVLYLILLLIDQIWKKSISTYINLNYLLIPVIILGILDVFSEKPFAFKFMQEKPKKTEYIFVSILALLGFIIIKYKTYSLGFLSWVISIIAVVLIILLSVLILEDE